MKMGNTIRWVGLVAVMLGASATVHATIEIGITRDTSQTAFSPGSSTDLINQGQPTLDHAVYAGYIPFTFSTFGTSTTAALNDGTPWLATSLTTSAFVYNGPDWTATYYLASAGRGFNIDTIDTYTAWVNGRDGQSYNLLYSTVADPTTFLSLTNVSVAEHGGDGSGNGSTKVHIYNNTGTPLAFNVAAIRFAFPANDPNVYRELDVFGVMVPEPSTIFLFGTGLATLYWAWRRRRASQ